MKVYTVTCYNKTSGKVAWSQSQEAKNPSEAIAQSSLPPPQRGRFIRRMSLQGLDELPELTVDHPGADMGRYYEIRAEVIP